MVSTIVIGEEICEVKPYGEQLKECYENGTLIKETCKCCGCILYLCKKYGGQCLEEKCYLDRLTRKNGGLHASSI